MTRALSGGCLLFVLAACGSEPEPPPVLDAGYDAFAGPADCAPGDREHDVLLEDGTCVPDDTDDDDDGTADTGDCAPRDPSLEIARDDGACVADDADDDDDGMLDPDDCAPLDPSRHVALATAECVRDDADDDDDGVFDVGDCAPRDRAAAVVRDDGTCVADDGDDDDDGTLDDDDCAPRDPTRAAVLDGGACVADDGDDDDDGALDDEDCDPRDPARHLALVDGRCVADDRDDDDDGVDDDEDCAPLDPTGELRVGDRCMSDDADDDDDGVLDAVDCAPLDPWLELLVGGVCVADDADDDDDGALDDADCAPREPASWVALSGGACVADDADDDDDGALDGDDCAPRDPARWLRLDAATCTADDADDDDDGTDDGVDCSPRDRRYATGACDVGEIDVAGCGSDIGVCSAGTRTRTCLPSCAYAPWSECGGTHVAPAAEACGTGLDEDCDGEADEGCACNPVAPGAAGSFPVPGDLYDLRVDPVRCLLYAFDARVPPEPSQFVVFDTRLKREVTRITLGTRRHDYDVAHDGSRIVIAYPDRRELLVIRPPDWSPTIVPISSEVFDVEVTERGVAIVRIGANAATVDLDTGVIRYSALLGSSVTMALAPDDRTLFVGDVNVRNGSLDRYAVGDDGTITRTESGPRGFPDLPRPYLAVSGDGRLVAWSGAIFEAGDLQIVHGSGYPWHLDAFDARGRVLVGGGGLIDVGRVRSTAAIWNTNTAALVSADEEVWWFEATTGRMNYANVADFLDPAVLGRREWAPLPLAEYDFTDVVVDPVRPWLYAIDGARGEVVVMDRVTLAPILEIEVGLVATDAELDPDGRYLYTGHANTWGVARVDLDALTYAGLVPTHLQPFEIAVPRTGRVVSTGFQQTDVTLSDTLGGTVLDTLRGGFYGLGLSVAPDGVGVYLGDSGTSASELSVLDTTGDALVVLRELSFADSVEYAARGIVTVPGTREVFWGGARWDTDALTSSIGPPETVRTVTPDGRLAISRNRIFDARTGAYVATLPVASDGQALSPDGRTLYLAFGGSIRVVDLAPLLEAP